MRPLKSRQVWVSLADEFSALVEFLLVVALLWGSLDEHTGCGTLGLASLTDLSSTLDINVLNILLLAENWEMTQHVNR